MRCRPALEGSQAGGETEPEASRPPLALLAAGRVEGHLCCGLMRRQPHGGGGTPHLHLAIDGGFVGRHAQLRLRCLRRRSVDLITWPTSLCWPHHVASNDKV